MKVHIKTYGCSLNHADSETMAGNLLSSGHELTDTESEADVVIYNTCTVKDPSQDKFLSKLKEQDRPVVIAGCIPQADKQGLLDEYPLLGTSNLQRTSEIVEQAALGNTIHFLEASDEGRLNLPKKRLNSHVEIVPICAGCLSACTYCKTKQARGNLRSYRPMEIQKQCEDAIAQGAKELWLTSQDNGAYGMDIKTNCAELLTRIASLEGDFMIRFGMTNPDWTKIWLEPLIEAFKHPKVYKFLHLPIQSGADDVLDHMGRRCSAQDIRMIVNRFREEIPDITIATDIICGYPTESKEDHEATLKLVEELKFPVINISKFYARPDTRAADLKQLPTEVKKQRSTELTRLFESEPFTSQRKNYVGQTVDALFVERKGNSNIGRTHNYVPVIVNSPEDLSGTWQQVHITSATRDDIRGSLANI